MGVVELTYCFDWWACYDEFWLASAFRKEGQLRSIDIVCLDLKCVLMCKK